MTGPATTIAAALIGALALERLHVPAGAMLGAMCAVAVVQSAGGAVPTTPGALHFLAFVVIGYALGAQFTPDLLRSLQASLLPILLLVVFLLVVAAAAALALHRWGGLDPVTAALAASPGGLSQMGALTSDSGARGEIVVTAHLLRILSVMLLLPLVARWLTHPP